MSSRRDPQQREAHLLYMSAYNKAYYAAHRERELARANAYNAANHQERRAYDKRYYSENAQTRRTNRRADYAAKRDRERANARAYHAANRERCLAARAAWGKANPDIAHAIRMKRVAAKLRATPVWANFDEIRAFYTEAARLTRETGIPHEVDHIYPLQGATVCGLHVAYNLQVLTRIENARKHNKLPCFT